MTKKDYEKAAKIVRRFRVNTPDHWIEPLISSSMEDGFIELFKNDNPRFDEKRFCAACKE